MTQVSSSDSPGLRYLKGVGPKRARIFEKIGITSVRDLLYLFPRRYEDRSRFARMVDLQVGQILSLRGEIVSVTLKRLRGRMTILDVVVGDDSGMVHAVWFNQPYLKNQFAVGQGLILYGKVDLYQNRIQISAPEYEILDEDQDPIHTSRITPVYPLTEGLYQRSLRKTLYDVVQNQLRRYIEEFLPERLQCEQGLMLLDEAIAQMHFPSSFEKQAEARRRIVFDELFLFELILLKKMARLRSHYSAHSVGGAGAIVGDFKRSLPFQLTSSQEKAISEIAADIGKSYPMNRLLQGDVGSGKTVVAAFALLAAAKSRLQGALLVPTEILAEQHYKTLTQVFAGLAVPVGLLTSSTPAPRREKMLADLKEGRLPVVVGTHALLQEDVQFQSLAIMVVDEQHKFGVHQRSKLLQRSPRPHQLVMTATPIPRTLALTVFGDLDISVMDELPAGRKPITTYWITREKQPEVLAHILERILAGEQAYVIFPLIDETEKSDLLAAKREFDRLKKGALASVRMGLVHGRVGSEERESLMKAFRRGEIQILVATSVVEVGVDNPNATVMVIENAERFGLSQLHQLRGRIGRGTTSSECFLFGEPKTVEGQKRLRIMTKTRDGFLIAEEDLRLRGPGEFLGTRQSGAPLFRTADLIRDQETLFRVREIAAQAVKSDPELKAPEWDGVRRLLEAVAVKY